MSATALAMGCCALAMAAVTDPGHAPAMDWTGDDKAQVYTLAQGTCHARVWQSPVGHWRAVVTSIRSTVGQENFLKVADAQAWCERQLAELVAEGDCTGRAGAPRP